MKEIKTRAKRKDIKQFDRAAHVLERARHAAITRRAAMRAKRHVTGDRETDRSPAAYAEQRSRTAANTTVRAPMEMEAYISKRWLQRRVNNQGKQDNRTPAPRATVRSYRLHKPVNGHYRLPFGQQSGKQRWIQGRVRARLLPRARRHFPSTNKTFIQRANPEIRRQALFGKRAIYFATTARAAGHVRGKSHQTPAPANLKLRHFKGAKSPVASSISRHTNPAIKQNNRIKAIKRFFQFLFDEGWIPYNPAEHLKLRKGHQPTIPSFTEEQVVALLKQPDQHTFTGFRDFVMLSLILDSGLRVGEMTKLKLNQVDIKESQLLGVIGKSKKPRDIPFCDDVRKLLLRYLKARGDLPSQHCFVTLDGRPLGVRSFQAALHKYGENAGITDIRVSPHTLRHTFAKMYILNDGDPYSLQDILGHTSQDMVKRYVNLWRPEMRSKHLKSSPMKRLYEGRLL